MNMAEKSGERPMSRRRLEHVLTREEFRRFSRPGTAQMIFDFSTVWGQAILGIAIFVYSPNYFGFIIGAILVGAAQHGLTQIAHEGVHNLIAPGRRGLNDFIAQWFFAAPAVLPYTLYRQRHLAHHRHVATDEDTKEMYRRDIRGWKLVREVLSALLGIDYIKQVFATLRRDKNDRMKETDQPVSRGTPDWIKKDIPPIAVAQLVLLGILSNINIWLYPLLWVLPIVTVSMLSSKIRSLVEHRPSADMAGTKPGSGFYMDTQTPCLRSVQATWLERILISKVNFHFHAEHHLWPFISYQHLPTLHRRMLDSPQAKEVGFTVEPSYVAAVRKLWAGK